VRSAGLDDADYTWETVEDVREEIAAVAGEASDARAEADHASSVGLPGNAEAAELAAERLDARVADLHQISVRIARGYPYWERFGFEEAVAASGEVASWRKPSEGRLPLPVQKAYTEALDTGLFDGGYEVCATFEPPDAIDEPVGRVTNYLFALRDGDSRGFFLVETWEPDGD